MLKASVTCAKDYIPDLCHAAREEDPTLSEQEIRDRVKADCLSLGLSADYIRDCIPKEFKDKVKSKAGKKGKEKQEEEKEKQKIELLTDGSQNSAQTKRAENTPESPKEQESKTLGSQTEERKEITEWKPDGDEDIEFLKKRLAKALDDNKFKDIVIDNKDKELGQLNQALKKTSFTPAAEYTPPPKTFQWPEPDEINTFVFKETTFDEFRRVLGPLKAGGNTKINVYLERIK